MNFVGEVVGEEADGDLALAVGVLVDRSGDDSFLEVGSHFREEVGGDELYFSFETMFAQGAADGEAVDRIHINSIEFGETEQEIRGFLKAFVLIFMAFHHADDFAGGAMAQKSFGKAVRFFAVVLG